MQLLLQKTWQVKRFIGLDNYTSTMVKRLAFIPRLRVLVQLLLQKTRQVESFIGFDNGTSTVVKHSHHHPMVKGFSAAAFTEDTANKKVLHLQWHWH